MKTEKPPERKFVLLYLDSLDLKEMAPRHLKVF